MSFLCLQTVHTLSTLCPQLTHSSVTVQPAAVRRPFSPKSPCARLAWSSLLLVPMEETTPPTTVQTLHLCLGSHPFCLAKDLVFFHPISASAISPSHSGSFLCMKTRSTLTLHLLKGASLDPRPDGPPTHLLNLKRSLHLLLLLPHLTFNPRSGFCLTAALLTPC